MELVEGTGTAPVVGDVNFDGRFNTNDLIALLQRGEYDDGNPLNSRWISGDWNGDREFNSRDLVVALSAGTFEAN